MANPIPLAEYTFFINTCSHGSFLLQVVGVRHMTLSIRHNVLTPVLASYFFPSIIWAVSYTTMVTLYVIGLATFSAHLPISKAAPSMFGAYLEDLIIY